jgi:manganese/zinc/iron transport system substrate-binding protein
MCRTFLFLVVLISAVGCQHSEQNTSDAPNRPRVVATVEMIADVARNIAGDDLNVITLIGPGMDPHLFKPTADTLATLRSADLVLYNGHHLEGKLGSALESLGASKRVVPLAEGIDSARLLANGDAIDPHLWMDVALWRDVAQLITEELIRLDPQRADAFRSRSADYIKQLDELHTYATTSIASIPADKRLLVTSHDAFNYLGRAYHIEVLAVQGISTESEAALTHVNDLVRTLVDRKVPSVFIESSVSPKGIRALIDGAASRGMTLSIGGELFSDATGPLNTYEGSYIGMIDHNITLITRALGGIAPERGLFGKLSHTQSTDQPKDQSNAPTNAQE